MIDSTSSPSITPILLVGAGKMGQALLNGWLENQIAPEKLIITDPFLADDVKQDVLKMGVTITENPADAGPFRSILLAVKPQMIANLIPTLAPCIDPTTIVMSVAAGIKLDFLQNSLPQTHNFARIMPNTPALIRAGMSAIFASPSITQEQKLAIDQLFKAVGATLWLEQEDQMDAVTALSGSGPAYVFHFTECLRDAGIKAGLNSKVAEALAKQTVMGAGLLQAQSEDDLAVLRQNVTSPGGTTQAGLEVLMADDALKPLIEKTVAAAKKRSIELGA